MGDSKIEWTDATWNPVRGCSKVSPGCKHCYAEKLAVRFCGPGMPYEGLADPVTGLWTGKVRVVPEHLADPLRWKKPRRIFVNSMSDLFHEALTNEEIAVVFGVMAATPRHTFQVLTKRAERMREWFRWVEQECAARLAAAPVRETPWELTPRDHCIQMARRLDAIPKALLGRAYAGPWPLPNVWLGVSVENQEYADERIPLLLDTPAAVRFISAEPLLGPVNLHRWTLGNAIARPADCACGHGHGFTRCPNTGSVAKQCHVDGCICPGFSPKSGLGWVIVGGESGPGARPFNLQWARDLVAQCSVAGVPVFVKQLGAVPVMHEVAWRAASPTPLLSFANRDRAPAGSVPIKLGNRKGGEPLEWPEDLRVREFPEATNG